MPGQQGDVENVKLGVADVAFGGVSLGLSKGGITVTVTDSQLLVSVDNWADMPVAAFDKGSLVEVTVPMVEETLAKINLALPTSTLTGSSKVTIGGVAGNPITAAKLVLNPVTAGRPNFVAYRAIPKGEVTMSFNTDDVSIINVVFTALIDSARPDGDQLCRFGGPSS